MAIIRKSYKFTGTWGDEEFWTGEKIYIGNTQVNKMIFDAQTDLSADSKAYLQIWGSYDGISLNAKLCDVMIDPAPGHEGEFVLNINSRLTSIQWTFIIPTVINRGVATMHAGIIALQFKE
jgi:hypothetical protein